MSVDKELTAFYIENAEDNAFMEAFKKVLLALSYGPMFCSALSKRLTIPFIY